MSPPEDRCRIVFVDDEAPVLHGLRRMLHPMSAAWQMSFCASAAEGLEALDAAPCDVLVTDIRMPGMNGIELLKVVRERHPHVVRIVLSGYADGTLVLESTAVAHQFLAKPCAPEELRGCIERTCRLRGRLADPRLLHAASRLKALPSLPDVYQELAREVRCEDPSLAKVGAIITKDLGMSAKVLQLVNSAFFGLRQQVSTPEQAAAFLGLDTIQALVLTVGVFSQLEPTRLIDHQRMTDHGLRVGLLAREIAKLAGADRTAQDHAYLAGLLHDVGKLIYAAELPEDFSRARSLARERGVAEDAAETEVLGASHAVIGGYLLAIWGLPIAVVEAVANHHDPRWGRGDAFTPMTAVHLANAFAHDLEQRVRLEFHEDYLAAVGVAGRVEAWRQHGERLLGAQG